MSERPERIAQVRKTMPKQTEAKSQKGQGAEASLSTTARPWRAIHDGYIVASGRQVAHCSDGMTGVHTTDETNASLIVQAVNEREELIAALRTADTALSGLLGLSDEAKESSLTLGDALGSVQTALAKAEGE